MDINILAIIVGLLAAAIVIAVVVGIFTVFILKKKKRKVIKEFKLELLTREEMIRKTSREGMIKGSLYVCIMKKVHFNTITA